MPKAKGKKTRKTEAVIRHDLPGRIKAAKGSTGETR